MSNINPLALLGDEPILYSSQDRLGLESWARVVAAVSIGTEGPFTIGIFGHWGVGKTSILRLAKSLVDSSKQAKKGNITTVDFNAAQYEDDGTALIPLVASIIHELDQKTRLTSSSKESVRALRDGLRSLLFGISAEATGKLPLFGDATIRLEADKAIDRYENLRSEWIDRQVEKSANYKALQALREIAKRKGHDHRIVVFIDDLDRCFPDKAIQLLQSMKLALNHPGFIFVLAVDPAVLESYLDKQFTEEFGLKDYHRGQSYLDKIIQLPLWIPPHEKRFEYLIESLLARPALEQHRNDFEPLAKVLALACEYNPRQLVRFINNILVSQEAYQLANLQGDFPLSAFIVAHGIRHQNDVIYQRLLRDEPMCSRISECKNAEGLLAFLEESAAETSTDDITRVLFRSLQSRESLVRLLTSTAGIEWLRNRSIREGVDAFLAPGWHIARKEVDELAWIHEQVERALLQLDSTDEAAIIASCEILSVLGDHQCLPGLRLARAKWTEDSRAGKVVFATYQKLMLSYGGAQST